MKFSRQIYWGGLPSFHESHFVRTVSYGPSILGGPARHGSQLYRVTQAPSYDRAVEKQTHIFMTGGSFATGSQVPTELGGRVLSHSMFIFQKEEKVLTVRHFLR